MWSLQNIRTVTSFGLQPMFEQRLAKKALVKVLRYVFHCLLAAICHFVITLQSLFLCCCRLCISFILAITYAYSQCINFFAYIIAIRFGAFQVTLDASSVVYVEFFDVYRVFAALIFGSLAVGAVGEVCSEL